MFIYFYFFSISVQAVGLLHFYTFTVAGIVLAQYYYPSIQVAVWRSGNMLVSINEVNLC